MPSKAQQQRELEKQLKKQQDELQEKIQDLMQAEVEKVKPYLQNENLVICEDDFLFNNRWWHTETASSDLVDYRKDLLLRSSVLFHVLLNALSSFSNLKRLKIGSITLDDLKQFEQVTGLVHLEIGALTIQSDSAAQLDSPVQMPLLKRLQISEFSNELNRSISFHTPKLDAVSFGKKPIEVRSQTGRPLILSPTNHPVPLRFSLRPSSPTGRNVKLDQLLFSQHLVYHCEFETLNTAADVSQFETMKTLICHQLFAENNVKCLVELMKLMPLLNELHCNFDGLTSLTDDYRQSNRVRDALPRVLEKLSGCKNPKNPRLTVFVQGIPLSVFQNYSATLQTSSAIALQLALTTGPSTEITKGLLLHPLARVHSSFVHAEIGKLFGSAPDLFSDPRFLRQFYFQCPSLQDVEVDLEFGGHQMDFSVFLRFLEGLRNVRRLVFNCCDVEPDFYSIVLPAMSSLANSLVVLKIYDRLVEKYNELSLYFLYHLKSLRFFGTNLICKDAIPYAIEMVDQFPFTFSFHFKIGEMDGHTAIIRKVAANGYGLDILERNYRAPLDAEKRHDLTPTGIANKMRLRYSLNNDPLCCRLLRHKFDDTQGKIIDRILADFVGHVGKKMQFDKEQAKAYIDRLIETSEKPAPPSKRAGKRVRFQEPQLSTSKAGLEEVDEQFETEADSESPTTLQSDPVDLSTQQVDMESSTTLQSGDGKLSTQQVDTESEQTLLSGDLPQAVSESTQTKPEDSSDQLVEGITKTTTAELQSISLDQLLDPEFPDDDYLDFLIGSGSQQSAFPDLSLTDEDFQSLTMPDITHSLFTPAPPSATLTSSPFLDQPATDKPGQSAKTVPTQTAPTQTAPTQTAPAQMAPAKTPPTTTTSAKASRRKKAKLESTKESPLPVHPFSALPTFEQLTQALAGSSNAPKISKPPAKPKTPVPSIDLVAASCLAFNLTQKEFDTLRLSLISISSQFYPVQRTLFDQIVLCANQICANQKQAGLSAGESAAQRSEFFQATNANLGELKKVLAQFKQLQSTVQNPPSFLPPASPQNQSLQALQTIPGLQGAATFPTPPPAHQPIQPFTLQDFQFGQTPPYSPLIPSPPTLLNSLSGLPFSQFSQTSTYSPLIQSNLSQFNPSLQGFSTTPTSSYSQFAQHHLRQSDPNLPATQVGQSSRTPQAVRESASQSDKDSQNLQALRDGSILVSPETLQTFETQLNDNKRAFHDLVSSRGFPKFQVILAIEQQFDDCELKLSDCKASIDFAFGADAVRDSQRQLAESLLRLKSLIKVGQMMLRPTTRRK